MSSIQFTTLIRLPFMRENFEDPPQAQWDADKDRHLWKFISKSSKTSDLNWVELATKFQVHPTFLLQQAAWLYERHLSHVRNQMKKVSGSTIPTTPAAGASTLTATGAVAMRRTGSAGSGAPRTPSVLSGHPKDSPSLRGGEGIAPAPSLSRTPSANTITQSRANTEQFPVRPQSTRSVQRPGLTSPKVDERRVTAVSPSSPLKIHLGSPDSPTSSSSASSSLSDSDHPAHRSQLFKRPPRFKQQRPRELSTFEEADATQENDSGLHGTPSLPFASAATRTANTKYAHDALSKTLKKTEQKVLQGHIEGGPPVRQKSIDQQSPATTEIASSIATSASGSDVQVPKSVPKSPMSPLPHHRAELGKLGSPRQKDLRSRREGSDGTPSMGSSFSDIDDAGISQSALEEALLSNMQHGSRMSTLSRYL
ncbi:hypothetical protein GQ44DRAFT_832719 [Phaeosphaeriaceae sp. PMI808]|nr:hypothetical protein GQ44DRAFT_832719 [Phaeosphaeriaceae sp. PMI808]